MITFLKRIKNGLVASAIIATMALAPLSAELVPQRVTAQEGCTAALVGAIADSIGLGAVMSLLTVPVNEQVLQGYSAMDLVLKCILNPLAWMLAQAALAEITDSLVQWIQNGFEGGPTFVTDLPGFMLGVGDQAAAVFLTGDQDLNGDGEPDGLGLSVLNLLCSPFAIDVQISLILDYFNPRSKQKLECTVSTMFANGAAGMQQFMEGDFSQGGWTQWLNMSAGGQNNPIGGFMEAQSELSVRIGSAELVELDFLKWAQGFFSIRDKDGKTITPGKYVEGQIQQVTGWPLDKLKLADSLDETLGALAQQLTMQLLAGEEGLLGAGTSDYFGNFREQSGNYGSDTLLLMCDSTIEYIEAVLVCAQTSGTPADIAAIQIELDRISSGGQCTLTTSTSGWQNIINDVRHNVEDIAARVNCSNAGVGPDLPGEPDPPDDNPQ